MKIGIMSDSHDNMINIKKAVEIFNGEKTDLVFHGGDHSAPFSVLLLKDLQCEVLAVFGNNDGDKDHLRRNFRKIGKIFERPREFILAGKKILLLHEPDNLETFGMSEKYDIIIYGHTHRKVIKNIGNTLVINPGETCGWITGEGTVMILDSHSLEVREYSLGKSPLPPLIPHT